MAKPLAGQDGQLRGLTPSQTVGPFLHLVLADPSEAFAVPEGTAGGFWLRGTVIDGNGEAVFDALVETWQADPSGRFDHPEDPRGAQPPERIGCSGFGRCATDDEGNWAIFTVKPGSLPGLNGAVHAPHLAVSVFARGLLDRVVTRVYFADEEEANAADSVLATLPDPSRRATLLAEVSDDGYRFDVRLQGDDETVFFEL